MSEELRVTVPIVNRRGLHARASAKFVTLVAKYDAEIRVLKDDNDVSGRSIMGLMMLGAGIGTTIDIVGTGPQAAEAVLALQTLIADRFQEDE